MTDGVHFFCIPLLAFTTSPSLLAGSLISQRLSEISSASLSYVMCMYACGGIFSLASNKWCP